ncbi:uncharacterized protein LOC114540089 [Dendronephthya gigantea]|uniref:uncharacterized protein LOC114540089 n=1 Tax=Dendronephthya gigantea TaxID=151771 RepID=UPI00106CF3F7|nr:uncharacterized protein LOC114540089 [Dendronephthya gigantea]
MSLHGLSDAVSPPQTTAEPVQASVAISVASPQLVASTFASSAYYRPRQFCPSSQLTAPLFPPRLGSTVSVPGLVSSPSQQLYLPQQGQFSAVSIRPPSGAPTVSSMPVAATPSSEFTHSQLPSFAGVQQPVFSELVPPLPSQTLQSGFVVPHLFSVLPPVNRVTPLRLESFRQELARHPDLARVNYVLDGIENGFSSGFLPSMVALRSSGRNMRSADEHPEVIDAYLATEVAKGRVAGPFATSPFPYLHCSPFGVIPKKGQPGKWRLILDLSSPDLHSVNDGVPRDPFSLHYISVDDAVKILVQLGPGALMAKFDVESAYRNIAMRPDERYLFGIRWRDNFFVDLALPFGLRSAPFIFNSVADLVEWILKFNYSIRYLLHYLDDFLILAPTSSSECAQSVAVAREVFSRLGLPLHPSKCEGPSTTLTFLGIELDSVSQMARLPQQKFVAILRLLNEWAIKRWCTRKELESLVGSLHHVTKVVPPGRSFLRRMINLLCAFRSPSHPIRLNVEFRRDLAWWLEFLQSWNGVSFFRLPSVCAFPDLFVASDSAGATGFGAIWRNAWFSGVWPASVPVTNITALELFPIVVAAHVWGFHWQRLQVQFLCDNDAVVAVINSGSSKDPLTMHLLRRLVLVACLFHFSISARHVPGRHNAAADSLSRSRLQEFHHFHPTADSDPTPIPSALVTDLLNVS